MLKPCDLSEKCREICLAAHGGNNCRQGRSGRHDSGKIRSTERAVHRKPVESFRRCSDDMWTKSKNDSDSDSATLIMSRCDNKFGSVVAMYSEQSRTGSFTTVDLDYMCALS